MSRMRRWLWRLAAALAVLAALYLGRARILTTVAEWLDVGQAPVQADYVAILGGGAETRPLVASALVKAGRARRVLISYTVTSAVDVALGTPPEREIIRTILIRRGIPESVLETFGHESATTYDEARALAVFLTSQPDARVTVVTNEYHTRRARWIIALVLGRRMDQVSMVSAPSDDYKPAKWWKTPGGFRMIVSEYLKLAGYMLRYSTQPYVIAAALLALAILLRVGIAVSHRHSAAGK